MRSGPTKKGPGEGSLFRVQFSGSLLASAAAPPISVMPGVERQSLQQSEHDGLHDSHLWSFQIARLVDPADLP